MPQTAKSRQMSVGYPNTGGRLGKRLGVELRICPRSRDRAHNDEQIYAYLLKQSQEFANRMCRMTYCENYRYLFRPSRLFCYHYL